MLMFNSQLNTCILYKQQLKWYVDVQLPVKYLYIILVSNNWKDMLMLNSQLNTCILYKQQLKWYVDVQLPVKYLYIIQATTEMICWCSTPS